MEYYYKTLASAFILGKYDKHLPINISNRLFSVLGEEEKEYLIEYGRKNESDFYIFKRSIIRPRVQHVLSYMHSLHFQNLLDIGSGRGSFLFPFMEQFPFIEVTSVDLQPEKCDVFNYINTGGYSGLKCLTQDATKLSFNDNAFDVVTALEVLEHIPNAKLAFKEIIRVAKSQVIISVPSKEDDNPEHIHLLTKNIFIQWITEISSLKYKFKEVKGHLIIIVKKQINA